jgi:alginate O-acetyltransferase complex protein AlgI
MLFAHWWYLPLLAVTVALYWSVRENQRKLWLTAGSLLIVTLVSWRSAAGFLVIALITYGLARAIRLPRVSPRVRTLSLSVAVLLNLGYLATFKYLPAYAPPAAALLRAFTDNVLLLPIGISYFTFRFLHYVIEARRGTLPEHGFIDFLCYASLFTVFPAGPIERFGHLQPQLAAPTFQTAHVSEGLVRIIVGSLKKIVVADLVILSLTDGLGRVGTEFEAYSWRSQMAWLWGRFLYTYFDFSGYTDIAVGTSRLFGLRVMENFNRPLLRTNLSEFWRSWHMSLTSWCRDYVYFPVFGVTRSPKVAVYASMLVLGAWHGTRFGWVVWGMWQATGLAIWQLWQARKMQSPALRTLARSRVYEVAAWAATLTWVVLGGVWVLFDSLGTSTRFLLHMVGIR